MSDIAILLPGDWSDLSDVPGLTTHLVNNVGLQSLQNMIDDGSWADLTMQIEDFWTPPAGMAMTGARVVSEAVVRFFVRIG